MIPFRISFPGQTSNAIAATQSITATAGRGVILNGSLAPPWNLTPSATTASSINGSNMPVQLPGMLRPITVFATSSVTNCIFTVYGADDRGNTITATFTGASGGSTAATDAIATGSGTDFAIVYGINCSASAGNFTVGYGATGVTTWYETTAYVSPFQLTVGGQLTATTTTYSVVHTYDNIQTSTSPATVTTGPVSNLATITFFAGYSATSSPVAAVRGMVTGNSATGGVTFIFTQAGV